MPTSESAVYELGVVVPQGSIRAGADDLIVLKNDGDLELHRQALTGRTSARITLIDHVDPRLPVSEGPGPNVIDDVAGVINGTLVFGDCCEPISGTVAAVSQPGGPEIPVIAGYSPNLSPNGALLATVNDFAITVADIAQGTGRSLIVNQQPDAPYRNIRDVEWLSETEIAVLYWTEPSGWAVTSYGAVTSTLTEQQTIELGVIGVGDFDQYIRFAGRGPGGELAVTVGGTDDTRIRFFDPATLSELADFERTLPVGVDSVELADDGLGLLWADDDVVYYLPGAGPDAIAVSTDASAAWFVAGPQLLPPSR